MKRVLDPLVGDNPIASASRVEPATCRSRRVRPPVVVRVLREFAAAPQSAPPSSVQPSWVERNIVSTEVPLLGTVTCHRKLIPMVRAVLYEIVERGLGPEIEVYSGCWASRTVARSPTAPPSYHAYGAAIDINAPQNPYGTKPTMDRRIVRIFESYGFNWGGDFLIPDGHHLRVLAAPAWLSSG